MPKTVKYVAIVVGGLIALSAIGAAIIAATFDPNHYKPQLIKLVQEKKQRTLTIPGDITLSFFPKLGADLGKVSISERNNTAEFASVESARLSVALIPLLSKKFVVDEIRIDGLRANIRKNKDGSSNFDDFLSKEKKDEPSQEIKFDVDSVDVNNAYVAYEDQQNQRRLELAKVNLTTGKIANGVPSKLSLYALVRSNAPAVNASVSVKTSFTMDLEQKHYLLRALETEIKGNLPGLSDALIKLAGNADVKLDRKQMSLDGIKLSLVGKREAQGVEVKLDIPKLAVTDAVVTGDKIAADAKMVEGTRTVTAVFAVPSFNGSTHAFKLPAVSLNTNIKDTALDAQLKLSGDVAGDIDKMLFSSPKLALALSGKQGEGGNSTALNGTLTTPLAVDLQKKLIQLPNLVANFTLPNPGGGAPALAAKGNAQADLAKEAVTANLKGKLDESSFDAKLGLAGFSPSGYSFNIDVDRIDLDRYKSKQPQSQQAAAKAPGKPAGPEKPMDLSALQKLNANGTVHIGNLKMANIHMSDVRATLHAANGKVEVNPLAANLYGGSVAGLLSLTAAMPLRIAVRQNLSGVQVGPLLRDALQKDPLIEGRGNVQLDVTTAGRDIEQFKKDLNGTARLALHDGSVKGINIAQTIRGAKSKLSSLSGGDAQAQTGTGTGNEKTDFSELTGSFRIANGVAHNDDLSLKSPLVRIGGNGDINIGEDRLDYLVKATVVSSLKGQGGPELQALRGVTIPIKLTGPYTAIAWHVDVSGMASSLAKQKLDEQKENLKGKAQKELQDQMGNGLKGLFGK